MPRLARDVHDRTTLSGDQTPAFAHPSSALDVRDSDDPWRLDISANVGISVLGDEQWI